MAEIQSIPGLQDLWSRTTGDHRIKIAILDGLVDQTHDCFRNAKLKRLQTLVGGEADPEGWMSQHGTHVASVLFGQHHSDIRGVAPGCQGILLPVFPDRGRRRPSQLDLSRAISQAVEAGAHVINISGGQLTDHHGDADPWLDSAAELCREHNILMVAAAGNDGCLCVHVPAAIDGVLAVGGLDDHGCPMDMSNFGELYHNQGIVAPGENILGAIPGGGSIRRSGTSLATPIVSGVVGLLLSLQLKNGQEPNPAQVRDALITSAQECTLEDTNDQRRCLAGKLNIDGAVALSLQGISMPEADVREATQVTASQCTCGSSTSTDIPERTEQPVGPPLSGLPMMENHPPDTQTTMVTTTPVQIPTSMPLRTQQMRPQSSIQVSGAPQASGISPQAEPDQGSGGLVYALGTLGYDFGTEARRDSFKQLMPAVAIDATKVPANPYDARQLVDYLADNPSEGKSLIWTLNLELTPIYALEPRGGFAREVYVAFQELMAGQVQPEDHAKYVERVSVPGHITGRTARLFSGQVVPVIEIDVTRGLYGWKVNTLVEAAVKAVEKQNQQVDEAAIRRTLGGFLQRIYYDLRNLGTTSQERALNFSATNAFQAAATFSEAVAVGMELDSIDVSKSPFCRIDSDCWDVKLKFFDPENSRRARKVFRFTIDVSDVMPVTLGEVRSWNTPM